MILFQTADYTWKAREMKISVNRNGKDTTIHVPVQPYQIGLEDHTWFALNSFKAFPDQRAEKGFMSYFLSGRPGVLDLYTEKSGGKSTWTKKS